MRTIEINTSQNVIIEYQLAGLAYRAFAYLIDLATIVISSVLLFNLIGGSEYIDGSSLALTITITIISLYVILYPLLSEVIGNGQSIGKLIMGIKVIRLNGEELEFYDYFGRWALRFVDIYLSIGSLAAIMIVSNKNGQRIGDMIAGTTVIKKNSSYGFTLEDIMKLNNKDRNNYEFTHPLARNLEERDVLLIKNLLYRKRHYNNKSHNEAFELLVKQVAMVVDEPKIPNNKEEFLNRVMTEYIIMTR